jgi:type II secretory pathway pseudopilin PulG
MTPRRLFPLLPLVILVHCRPSPQVTAPPAPPAPPVPQVQLVTDGLSPHFLTVASRLEVGGSSFSYLETDTSADLLSSFFEQAIDVMPAAEKAKLPPNFSVKKVLALFGLDSIKAAGTSSRTLTPGRHHARSFAYAPAGRSGLLSLTGGPAETLLLHQFATQDTDLALEFPLRLKDWFAQAWSTLIEIAPESERQQITAQASTKLPGVNLSIREIAEKLDLRLALFATLHPEQKLALPGFPTPLPGIDAALVIERLGPFNDLLKQQVAALPKGDVVPFDVTEKDGLIHLRFRQPVMPAPMDFQPALLFDPANDRLILATRPAYLDALLSPDAKLAQSPAFAAAWNGLPKQGNGCLFLSQRFMTTLMDGIKQAVKAQPGAPDESGAKAVIAVIDSLGKDLAHPQALCYANEKDGIIAAANSSLPTSQVTSLSALSSIAVLASIAVPSFNSIQTQANQQAASSQARQIGVALMAYASDHDGRFPATLTELTTGDYLPDPSVLFYKGKSPDGPQPWLYNPTLSDTSPSSAILLAAPVTTPKPSGTQTRVVLFQDLSVQNLAEDQFQQERDENLR